jgi:hypothetical protein
MVSMPSLYLGKARSFKTNKMVTSEIRSKYRRGVTPQHILYVGTKILRQRVGEGLYATFRCVGQIEHITERMTDVKGKLESCIEKNLSFF